MEAPQPEVNLRPLLPLDVTVLRCLETQQSSHSRLQVKLDPHGRVGRTWGPADITGPLKQSAPKPTLPQGSELPHAQLQGARFALQSTSWGGRGVV